VVSLSSRFMQNFVHTEQCNRLQRVKEARGYRHYEEEADDCDCSCHSNSFEQAPVDSV